MKSSAIHTEIHTYESITASDPLQRRDLICHAYDLTSSPPSLRDTGSDHSNAPSPKCTPVMVIVEVLIGRRSATSQLRTGGTAKAAPSSPLTQSHVMGYNKVLVCYTELSA